jgi:hypothetical protein
MIVILLSARRDLNGLAESDVDASKLRVLNREYFCPPVCEDRYSFSVDAGAGTSEFLLS